MGRFANLVDNPEGIESFKARYRKGFYQVLPSGGMACLEARGRRSNPYDCLYRGRDENPYG